jgi:uracil-DNA glycosylase family 4
MNNRKKEILNELNLLPLWRLKVSDANVTIPPSHLVEENTKKAHTNNFNETRDARIAQMNWQQLKTKVAECTACTLCETRTQTVLGTGDKQADWLYIGEGPGEREDTTGEPFAGPAGKLFDNMLMAIGLNRENNVYITNIVKCRPPSNRNPATNEAQQCEPYLARQIALIKPKLIIALGKTATQNLLKQNDSIADLRGKLHHHNGTPLIVTYHPAYLLRSLTDKRKAWQDLCFAKATMQSLKAES